MTSLHIDPSEYDPEIIDGIIESINDALDTSPTNLHRYAELMHDAYHRRTAVGTYGRMPWARAGAEHRQAMLDAVEALLRELAQRAQP